ncbi:hypothetical protein [Novosphingobium sp.]|uniref:hypothetical protein n=1 Tax=Novosphingobium sp. TaxID=1874826 RepID=UPI00286AD7C2|nr:hypothetical protein [Novosphingobium sp.]
MDPALAQRLLAALVGKPMVSNAFRGTLVEAILAEVLEPEWRWLADGWGSFDFEGPGGVRLEVKQSAARQDWHLADAKPNKGRFDIASRTGRWEDTQWITAPGRAATIYIFAWHPLFDPAAADHRDPRQWQFYVVAATSLPEQKTISLSGVQSLARPCGIENLKAEVGGLFSRLR